ncbi:MAG: four helix bundle protein [Bacteroidetes bacterium]|nr:four helix bundle protein [Bacteroidota bacterium]MBK8658589.1 four helix bundle protein [Bacteroidota bacterium]
MDKKFDLGGRTNLFAKEVRKFVMLLPKNFVIMEDAKQLVRASGSVGANYIEAQDPISEKDAFLRIRICRKEAKESGYWLDLLSVHNFAEELEKKRNELMNEAIELTKIFGAITSKLKNKGV